MLFAIDLQNDYWDPSGKYYVAASQTILQEVIHRLEQAVSDGELLVCIRNTYGDEEREERGAEEIQWAEAFYPPFASFLEEAEIVRKSHYGIAPEEALQLKEKYSHLEDAFDTIEFIGVETNVCVMANVNIIQNIFTTSALLVHKKRTAASSERLYKNALEILAGLKVLIEE